MDPVGDVAPFLDLAAEAGLDCTPAAPDSWLCLSPDLGPPGSVSIDTGARFGGFSATVYREGSSGAALDMHDLMDRYVALILGDDPDAVAWLDGAQTKGLEYAELERPGWSIVWSTVDPSTGATNLTITRLPTAGASASAGPEASVAPHATPPASPSVEGVISNLPGGQGPAGAQPFASSIPTVADVSTDPTVVLQSALLAGLLVFLMPFPSQLFNSTLEKHEDRVRRRFGLDRIGRRIAGLGSFWTSWPGAMVAVLVGALLYGFLDPTFGSGPGSLATFLGILLGIVIVTFAFAVPLVAMHRRAGDRASIKVVPISLLVAVGCVLISRLTAFQPGYLYGLLIGVGFARELSATDEGRATALGATLMLAAAALAWLVLGAMPPGTDFGLVVIRTALAALMVAGLEGVVFGLLPVRTLPGEVLFRWRRPLWAVLLLLGAFAFFHILINPASGYLSDTSRTPLITVLVLLVGFSLGSIAFWAWFRLRPDVPVGRT